MAYIDSRNAIPKWYDTLCADSASATAGNLADVAADLARAQVDYAATMQIPAASLAVQAGGSYAAIKAQTDLLPSDPASTSALETYMSGTGVKASSIPAAVLASSQPNYAPAKG